MRTGIVTYRIFSALLLVLLVFVVWLATDGRIKEAGAVLGVMVVVTLALALMLRCQHCGARPGLWLLAIWTALLSPEFYFADALFLRKCPRCHTSLSTTKGASGAV